MDIFTIVLLLGILFLVLGVYLKLSNSSENQKVLDSAAVKKNIAQAEQQKVVEVKQNLGHLYICYGSQSGTAAKYSNLLAQEASDIGFQAEAKDLQEYKDINYKESLCIFLMATYGEGEPTDNAKEFYKVISKKDNEDFGGLRFAVFGLGNSQYENYNAMGIKVNELLEKLGGQRVYKYGQGDDNCSLEEDFDDWRKDLWKELKAHALYHQQSNGQQKQVKVSKKKSQQELTLEVLENTQPLDLSKYDINSDKFEYDFQTKKFFEGVQARLIDIQEIRQNKQDGSTLHMIIDLENTNIQYETAQNLAIFMENDPSFVQTIALYLNVQLDDVVTFKEINDHDFDIKKNKLPFPVPIRIKDILTYFCDFQGPIMKRVLKELAALTENQDYKQKLELLASSQGKDQFQAEIENVKLTVFDLLKQYEIKPDFHQFIKLCPRLSPRLYTISSSSKLFPNQVHVTASMQYDVLPNDQVKVGIASQQFERYLQDKNKFQVRVQFRESSFKLVDDRTKPIIMIGPGTGIAPFRAFIQENEFLIRQQQQHYDDMVLYFGCRHEEGDFIFRDELKDYLDRKVFKKLYTAFSRDGDQKVYVQDLILKNQDEILESYLKGGIFYICGSTSMGRSVSSTLMQIFQNKLEITEEKAKELLHDLENKKRLIKELW